MDTGAAGSVVARPNLEALGWAPDAGQPVVLADGRVEKWWVTQVDIEGEGRSATTPVVMEPPAAVMLGATTLEAPGLGLDPLNRRLAPVDVCLACGSSTVDSSSRRSCSTA